MGTAGRTSWLVLQLALTAAVLTLVAVGLAVDDPPVEAARPAAPGTADGAADGSSQPGAPEPVAPPGASPGPQLEEVAVTLTEVAVADEPIALTGNAANGHLYVAERPGRVRLIRREPGPSGTVPVLEPAPLLDISDEVSVEGERGMLGLAITPAGDRLYVSFTALDGDIVIDEYEMAGDEVDVGSRREVLRIPHPLRSHNGGDLEVGPDGNLWVGIGDGGAPEQGGQPEQAADLDLLLGKLLRVDPDGDSEGAYGIPADNPYADGGGRPDVWASGLRNPWRFGFDPATDDLWIGDVGQMAEEEIDVLPAADGWLPGADLGWPAVEGTVVAEGEAPPDGLVAPVLTYPHSDGRCAVIGGGVYRGATIPALQGAYVYTDLCAPELRALVVDASGVLMEDRALDLAVPAEDVASFGFSADGELYVLSLYGSVFRVDPA